MAWAEQKTDWAPVPAWDTSGTQAPDEWILISHNRDELRRVMSDYVGIVRSNLRLERAARRPHAPRKPWAALHGRLPGGDRGGATPYARVKPSCDGTSRSHAGLGVRFGKRLQTSFTLGNWHRKGGA